MPTYYKRKNDKRAQWSADSLKNAVQSVQNDTMQVNQAARNLGIPRSTLIDRVRKSDAVKKGLGPSSCLGEVAESKLENHIKKLQKFGFAPDRDSVRSWAYELAEQLKVRHTFKKEKHKAGYDWLNSFLRRHPSIPIRIAKGISIARTTGINKETVYHYFTILQDILTSNNLHDKPLNIFNMDETGLQLNNKPGEVLAAKESKNVSLVTPAEKGETISVIACCNAEGMFLPPYAILKGKNKKAEFLDGMPPGSQIAMSKKSAYINATIVCINCTDLCKKLGPTLCLALSAFHAFTGCDYTAAFFNKGKVRPFNLFLTNPKIQQVFATLTDPSDIFDEEKIESVQEFTCRIYGIKNCQSVNTGRFIMFNKMYAAKENNEKFIKKIKGFDSTHILPCWKSLKQKMLRTIFVNSMWLNATEFDCVKFSAENNGWLLLDGFLKPRWFLGSSTPTQVV